MKICFLIIIPVLLPIDLINIYVAVYLVVPLSAVEIEWKAVLRREILFYKKVGALTRPMLPSFEDEHKSLIQPEYLKWAV